MAKSRCTVCFRPGKLCFCSAIPHIANRTRVLLIQHRRERFHAFNTARIVHRALDQCGLITDHTESMSRQLQDTSFSPNVGLLYPSEEARLLSEIDPQEYPDQLVIIDGTWNQAKALFRELPQLKTLPQYRLAPTSPSRYRIRREPSDQAISTLEATVAALSVIEPETEGFDLLLRVFDQMIDGQVQVVEDRTKGTDKKWRKRKRRTLVSNVPRCLCGDLSNVVVAYGESEFRSPDADPPRSSPVPISPMPIPPRPIYWVAQRLGSNPTKTDALFRCLIESPSSMDGDFLERLRLNSEESLEAVSSAEFTEKWKRFLRPHDQVVVYHPNTMKLLQNATNECPPPVVLKAVKLGRPGARGTLDDVIRSLGIRTEPHGESRAMERLALAVGLVHYLNDWCLSEKEKA